MHINQIFGSKNLQSLYHLSIYLSLFLFHISSHHLGKNAPRFLFLLEKVVISFQISPSFFHFAQNSIFGFFLGWLEILWKDWTMKDWFNDQVWIDRCIININLNVDLLVNWVRELWWRWVFILGWHIWGYFCEWGDSWSIWVFLDELGREFQGWVLRTWLNAS